MRHAPTEVYRFARKCGSNYKGHNSQRLQRENPREQFGNSDAGTVPQSGSNGPSVLPTSLPVEERDSPSRRGHLRVRSGAVWLPRGLPVHKRNPGQRQPLSKRIPLH
uniref:(northern house mosquito) hypothetical protein n=1 Tax=Culex pipiens TaxID=7175 RepID=A0A8D8B624_CULPI